MMRLLIRWFLSLCLLFLTGYAPAYQGTVRYAPKDLFERAVQAGLSDIQSNEGLIFRTNSTGTKNGRHRLKAIVIEEDEESSTSRKNAESSNSCITFYNSLANQYIDHDLDGRLPFCEHFSYFASSKLIMHCVIRI